MATVEELESLLDDLDIDRDLAKAELETAQGKIEKAEARKDKVKPEIYQKVVGEYVAARDAAEAKFDEIEAKIAATHAEIEAAKAAAEEAARRAEEDARLAEEEARRAEEEAARRAEEERIAREEDERRAREEAERLAREEAERAAREEEERLRAEEEAQAREEAERAAREDEAKNAEANRRREEDRQAAREMIASLVTDRDAVMAEMAGPQNEMEEIEFRKEMGEFESDDDYEAAAAPVRDQLSALNDRIAGIDAQIRELAAAHDVESPVGAAPGAEAATPAAALAPAETDAVETLLESAPVDTAAAPVAATEEVEEAEDATDVHEEVVETLEGDWSDVERRFFESSADHRFFVNPCLIMQDPSGRERVFEIAHEITTLGSAGMGEVDVMIEHASVDKKHARIKLEHGRYIIKDLGSKKGTYVNGKRIKKERLNHLDKVKLGDVFLQVRLM